MPTGAPPRARRRFGPPPLWRFAPRRLLHESVTLALMFGVLTMLAMSAAAGPLYAEAVSDAAVRLALDSVPAGAAAKTAPVVRLNGGIDPESRQWTDMLGSLEAIPGVGPARVTTQSISTELHPSVFYDPVGPVVTGAARQRAGAPVRRRRPGRPAGRRVPGRERRRRACGCPIRSRARRASPRATRCRCSCPGWPRPLAATTRVLGTYAVQRDGRTPQDPPGRAAVGRPRRRGLPLGLPSSPPLRAHLAVADLATTAALAKTTGDQLLWTAQSRLTDPTPRLAQFHRTADAVSLLRRLLTARSELADDPVALRPSIASGVEDLADRADVLVVGGATRRGRDDPGGHRPVPGAGRGRGGYSMGRRRREVQLAAGTGRRPVSAGLLYAAELVPAAVVAGVVGWFAARAVVAVTVGHEHPEPARCCGPRDCGAPQRSSAALVASAVVAAVANRVETRRLEGRPEVRLPWVLVLVVVAASATVGLLTRPPAASDPLGPLDLLVPPLVVAAVAAVGSRLFFAVLRRARATAPDLRPAHRGDLAGAAPAAGPRPRARGGHDDRGDRPRDARLLAGVPVVPARHRRGPRRRGGRRRRP